MKHGQYPMVLQNCNHEFMDHIINMMMISVKKNQFIERTTLSNGYLPLIFVIITISKPWFIDEFINGFLNQDYPRERLIICICTKSKYSGNNYLLTTS